MFNLKGSIVALVTPMNMDGSIDWQSLSGLIDWHIDSGTSGIVVVGTTGESPTIDVAEHVQIIENCVNHSNDRIRIIAGTGANSTKEAIYLTAAAKEAGAHAALLVTPYYNKPTQEGLFAHYHSIANQVDIPQILYNVPSRTGCDLLPETVFRLASHENIIGLKEATGCLSRLKDLQDILLKLPENNLFLLYSGDDVTSTEFMLNGGSGTISVTANVVPHLISRISALALNAEFKKSLALDKELKDLNRILFIESNPIPVKYALYKMGRIPNGIRLPLTELSKENKFEMERILKEFS
jgi:4-hydroxy-tetrahydrodipicolinate synthase|tara:strand:+ start:541 stop:1431 length:891 start_codon:yes stop_codon:yes gene_type:complete